MSSSSGNNICDNCRDEDGRVYIHTMCQTCRENHEENLFQQPPQKEDCPICFLTLPLLIKGSVHKSCCGKLVCSGCIHAVHKMDDEQKCPFCRVPTPTSDDEIIEMAKKRVEVDDVKIIRDLGCCYNNGTHGLPQDWDKALELWHRAGELGSASAYYSIGNAYWFGEGVERDIEKARHFWEVAAMGGEAYARYNLADLEEDAGNMDRALKHYMIAVGCGDDESLKRIREFYTNGHATKDDYAKALRAYQTYVDGIKSAQRDEAAAYNSDEYRYY